MGSQGAEIKEKPYFFLKRGGNLLEKNPRTQEKKKKEAAFQKVQTKKANRMKGGEKGGEMKGCSGGDRDTARGRS